MEQVNRSCADCGVINCDNELLSEALAEYETGDNKKIMKNAADVEYEYYLKMTRVEETVEFAKRMGYKKIGIATCVGLINETRILTRILRNHGFEVFGIACKAGAVRKSSIGIREDCEKIGINMCNPIHQAMRLNKEKTDFNIVMGLCVGHDSLFYKYSDAPVTTLVTKDRVLGHNPAAALYTANSYYIRVNGEDIKLAL